MKQLTHFFIIIASLFNLTGLGPTAKAQMQFSSRAESAPSIVWRGSARLTGNSEGVITITATMAEGWHLYGMSMPDDGPRPTTFTFDVKNGWELSGKLSADRKPISKHDTMFNAEVQYWEGKVVFTQKFRLTGTDNQPESLHCTVNFMGCNDQTCLPPQKKEFNLKILPKK